LLDRRAAAEAKAGHVHEQITYGHRVVRPYQPFAPVGRALPDLEITPLRDEAADRIGKREKAALVQRQQRDAGDRLGHRVDAPDRVFFDRQRPLQVPRPEGPEVTDVTMANHGHLAAGDTASVYVAILQMLSNPVQLPLVQTCARSVRFHE